MTTLVSPSLDSILSADPGAATRHLGGLYAASAGRLDLPVVLYGAGHLGRRTLAGLRQAGIEPLAFVDRDPLRWGEAVDGLKIVSPADAIRRWATGAAFVVAVYHGTPVREWLRSEGCEAVVACPALYHRHPEAFLPFGGVCAPEDTLSHADELRQTYALLQDDASREAFLGQLRWRLTLDYAELPTPSPEAETYFVPEVPLREDEMFVDCGAFDGDSLQAFFARVPGGKAIAIEPDPVNATRLVERLKGIGHEATVHNVAAASAAGTLAFEANGTAGSNLKEGGALAVSCARLDDLLADEAPTFLKMDIEGAEMDALRGAIETIRAHRPVLAICLYHKPEDLWEIPLFIASLGVHYRYALRVHAEECWEIVLYAAPAERWRA